MTTAPHRTTHEVDEPVDTPTDDTQDAASEGLFGGVTDDGFCYLRLYVAGQSPKSLKALANLKRLCEEHLPSRYEIEVVDLVENPGLAAGDEIIAIPTLVRRVPAPLRKIIGDLSDWDRVIVGLQLLTTKP